MSPTSRNTLMIGGALILIALLLVCGPLSGRFGSGGSNVEEAPSVAAGPPSDGAGSLGVAATGAMAGAVMGAAEADSLAADEDPCDRADGEAADDTDCPPVGGESAMAAQLRSDSAGAGLDTGAVVAGSVLAAGAGAAVAADGIGGGGGGGGGNLSNTATGGSSATPPPVSAGVPSGSGTNVAGPGIALAAAPIFAGPSAAEQAAGFDDAVASARDANDGVGAAGTLADRFPPPVAAPGSVSGMAVASSVVGGPLILPCDTPGSGCRNTAVANVMNPPPPPPGGGGNPPIIPGGPPPIPNMNNPPIVPGGPPPNS